MSSLIGWMRAAGEVEAEVEVALDAAKEAEVEAADDRRRES